MTWRDRIESALRILWYNKLRTFLTMIGIVVGVTTVIVLVSLGEAVSGYVEGMLGGLGFGKNALSIHSGKVDPPIERSLLRLSHVEDIQREVDDIVGVVPVLIGSEKIQYVSEEIRKPVWGVSEIYPYMVQFYPTEGRFFDKAEYDSHARVCVLGYALAERFAKNYSPVGTAVRIGSQRFTCIGVMEQKGEVLGMNLDDMVIVPVTTAQDILKVSNINEIILWVDESASTEWARQQVSDVFIRGQFKEGDFHFHSQEEILGVTQSISVTMSWFVACIAAISLLVGSIGITNIMLVSVMERTREIGVRKAVGASDREIFFQFLTEAAVVSFLAGLCGLVLGVVSAALIMYGLGVDIIISQAAVLVSVGIAVGVGVVAGTYPAYRASQLHPIEALRYS